LALVILELGLLFFLAHVFAWLFQRTKIPDVLLLIILGMLLGPVFGAVGKADFGKAGGVMTNITLVVILFESGLSLDMKALREGLTATTKLTLVSFFASIAVVAPIGVYLMGMSWAAGILMGVILGGTSSAVVIPLVAGLGLAPAAGTVLVLESAITDVLCIVGAVAGISTAVGGGEVAI
jgi:NhaP-type Na+/H+ or K+/H+ antiporter